MNYYVPKIGDVLTRQKLQGLIPHCGVVIGLDRVLQNTPERGEHLVSISDFAAGQRMEVSPTDVDPTLVIQRSQKILANPKRYHAANRNCQHTVSEVIHGIARSPLAVVAIIGGLILLIIGLVAFSRKG